MCTEDEMRTTLDLPESLIAEALRVSHHSTKTAVIVAALEELARKNRIQALRFRFPCTKRP